MTTTEIKKKSMKKKQNNRGLKISFLTMIKRITNSLKKKIRPITITKKLKRFRMMVRSLGSLIKSCSPSLFGQVFIVVFTANIRRAWSLSQLRIALAGGSSRTSSV